MSANATPSKGRITTLCKNEIKESFDDTTKTRIKRFKNRANGTTVTYNVSFEGTDAQKVTCTFSDGVASLIDSNGEITPSIVTTDNTCS